MFESEVMCMCEYMEYTINARVCFYGTYKGLFKKLTSFSENGYITFSVIAINEDEALEVLRYKIDEMCTIMTQRGEFHFCFSDDFYGDNIYLTIPRLHTVHGSIADFSVKVNDPRKWTIQKVIEKCSVEEAVAIFGERISWLLGILKTDGDDD